MKDRTVKILTAILAVMLSAGRKSFLPMPRSNLISILHCLSSLSWT